MGSTRLGFIVFASILLLSLFGSRTQVGQHYIEHGPPPFISMQVRPVYQPAFHGYAGIGGEFSPQYTGSGSSWTISNVEVRFHIEPGYNVVNCTLVDFNGNPKAQPLEVYFINFIDSDYFCTDSSIWSCVINSKKGISGSSIDGKYFVSPTHDLVISYTPNVNLPVGTCTVYYQLPSTMDYLWKCYFADGTQRTYSAGGYSFRDDLKSTMTFYHGNIGKCIAGYLGDEVCIDEKTLGRYYVSTEGVVSTKATQSCTDLSEYAICDSTQNKCVCPPKWIETPYCKPGDPSHVYRKKLDPNCQVMEAIYETCSSDQYCEDGKCVCVEGYVGDPYCKPDDTQHVYRKYMTKDCIEEERVIETCEPGYECQDGRCVQMFAPPTEEVAPTPSPEEEVTITPTPAPEEVTPTGGEVYYPTPVGEEAPAEEAPSPPAPAPTPSIRISPTTALIISIGVAAASLLIAVLK